MKPELNIPNLNRLITHLEAQPPETIDMGAYAEGPLSVHLCGTAGCIAGWSLAIRDGRYDPDEYDGCETFDAAVFLGMPTTNYSDYRDLFCPPEFSSRKMYPAHRVIATLKRLRDHFLATGEVVVDWGPEPSADPAQPWSAPQATELSPPELPESLTKLLSAKPVEV
jgi:hypothetical protein